MNEIQLPIINWQPTLDFGDIFLAILIVATIGIGSLQIHKIIKSNEISSAQTKAIIQSNSIQRDHLIADAKPIVLFTTIPKMTFSGATGEGKWMELPLSSHWLQKNKKSYGRLIFTVSFINKGKEVAKRFSLIARITYTEKKFFNDIELAKTMFEDIVVSQTSREYEMPPTQSRNFKLIFDGFPLNPEYTYFVNIVCMYHYLEDIDSFIEYTFRTDLSNKDGKLVEVDGEHLL